MSEPINPNQISRQISVDQISAELPLESKFYFNGFTVGISPMDCSIVLMRNNQPIALLNTTHVIARAMSSGLEGLIKDFEDKTGQHVMKLDELKQLLENDKP